MALSFRKIKRKVMSGKEKDSVKYYALAVSRGESRLPRLCNLISERSSVSSADVKSVVDSLVWAIGLELKEGNAVVLDELGTFRLRVNSDGVANENELTANHIRRARIRFVPCKSFSRICSEVKYTPLQTVERTCDKEHLE